MTDMSSTTWTGRPAWAEAPLAMLRDALDELAARFGFYRHLPAEMIIFRSYEVAHRSGFRGPRHPDQPHVWAWWPGQRLSGLFGRPLYRVTIDYDMAAYPTDEGRLGDLLRKRQMAYGDRAIWIEL